MKIILLTAATSLTFMRKNKVEPQVRISCQVSATWKILPKEGENWRENFLADFSNRANLHAEGKVELHDKISRRELETEQS